MGSLSLILSVLEYHLKTSIQTNKFTTFSTQVMVEEQNFSTTELNQESQDNNVKYLTEGGNAAFHNYINDFAHIEDPLERRRLALQKIDETAFGWSQIRTILIAGVGFLTDSYDIFAINLGITMMSYVHWKGNICLLYTSRCV